MPGYTYRQLPQPPFRPPPVFHYPQQQTYGMQMGHGMPGWRIRPPRRNRQQIGGGYGMAPQHPHGYGGMPAPPPQGLGMQRR